MKRIVFDGNCNVVESTSTPPVAAPAKESAPAVEFEPPKKRQYVPKQYNPSANTYDTRYKGGCNGCGR